jgi:hypothetical protein
MLDAPADKHYYAWLLVHSENIVPVHWSFTVHNNQVSPPSYSDPQHMSLLTNAPDLFLITLQSADTGVVPSLDPKDRLYYASIPEQKSPTDGYSVVDHLNHLLADDPSLKKLGLNGGLNYWLLRNAQAVSQQATSARTAWQGKNSVALRQHLVNILYYLDSSSCAPSALGRAPNGTPLKPDTTIAQDTSASLLECKQNTNLPGIPMLIQQRMTSLVHAPGATQNQIALTQKIQPELTQMQSVLQQLHSNVLQLIQMPDAQLLQPSQQNLIDTTVMMATTAYSGTASQPGAQQVSTNIQQLATFDILPCPQSSSNNVCLS